MSTHVPQEAARKVQRGMSWIGRHELGTMILITLVVAGVWGFVEIADEVLEQETQGFDRTVLLAMRTAGDPSDPIGPRWLEEIGRDFTALGGWAVQTVITMAVVGFLLLQRKLGATALILAAVLGGLVLSMSLKHYYSRPRPDLVPHGSLVYTSAFPSGHSMMAATTYLTLGAVLARVQPRRSLKAYLLLLAMALTGLVGISRVYLGVHWPTDVLAGWTAGLTWALLCWLVARWLQRRGKVETDAPAAPEEDAADSRDDLAASV